MNLRAGMLVLIGVSLVACGDDSSTGPTDGGGIRTDGGGVRTDGGGGGMDGGGTGTDSGGMRTDSGGMRTDGGGGGTDSGAPDEDAAPAACGTATDCAGCTPMGACGWCETSHSCMEGVRTGPTTGTCADWRYVSSECMPPDCAGGTSCETCSAIDGCGWCESSHSCVWGGFSGPHDGMCADWRNGMDECGAGPPCAATDCATCTGMSACGWCPGTSTCSWGTTDGPRMGTCAASWAWISGECPGADAGM